MRENVVICLRIISRFDKNYIPTLEAEVQPFLDIVQKIYSELPKTVKLHFKGNVIELRKLIFWQKRKESNFP